MRSPSFAAALLCAAFVAGCGSSSSTTSGSTTSTSAPAAAGTSSTPPTTSINGAAAAAGVAQYVAVCRSVLKREPSLPANVKAKVEGICNKAANGDLEGARKAAKEVCVEVIKASPIPSVAKEEAIAACEKSG
jgi:hypothetical protein